MRYMSCFTGIGGLEGSSQPHIVCEIDEQCQAVLQRKFPTAELIPDIADVSGFEMEIMVGGWPCQDLSVAGRMRGLGGEHSKQFYQLLNVCEKVKSHTLIAENVPNLLVMQRGKVFREVLTQLREHGFRYCSWRTLNSRQFGLPHQRNRIFLVASKYKHLCFSLFRDLDRNTTADRRSEAAGFYWTAGSQSICYSDGYVPTIKVGSSLSIASPPAVHYGDTVRMLSAKESLKLQGFETDDFRGIKDSDIYRMAGNAVSVPVGKFVVDGVLSYEDFGEPDPLPKQQALDLDMEGTELEPFLNRIPTAGFFDGDITPIKVKPSLSTAKNLIEFLDVTVDDCLNDRQASGLLRRLSQSGVKCPKHLINDLERIIA